MAFGFTPKHIEDLYLDTFTPQHFLILAIETAKKVGWRIDFISETGFIANTDRGRFKRNSEVTFKIDGEKATIKSESTGSEMFDLGFNKRTVRKFTDAFIDFKYSFKPEELDQKFKELKPTLVPKEQDVLSQPPPTTSEKISSFFSIFIPREGYFITPILVDINILIFILMVASGVSFMLPDNDSLIKWGANFRPVTLEGEWWRLITNCFLHIGVVHLLMNMYALLYIGLLLEPRLGKTKFISAYFLTGITASISSLWWHDMTISAGASGAIFGMYGVFLAMLTTNLIEKTARKALLTSIGIFVAYNLMYGMKGGIDNAAHIGGLIGGLIIGYAYYPSLKKPEEKNLQYSIIGILTVLVLSTSFMVYRKIPNDIPKYDEKIKTFVSNEAIALEIYHMPKNSPKEKLLSEIKDRGLYYWNENTKLINELEQLSIPEFLHERNKTLLRYCDLRIKSYNLIYKAIDEDTDKYQSEIENYTTQIEAVIASLSGKPNDEQKNVAQTNDAQKNVVETNTPKQETIKHSETSPDKQKDWSSLPKPMGSINDFEGLFNHKEELSLDSIVRAVKAQTGIKIAIVTLDTLATSRNEFADFTFHIAEAWGLGKNGILIGISRGHKTMRIHNSPEVVNLISDYETKIIIDNFFIPGFRAGNYYDGTVAGLTKIIELINKKHKHA